MSKVVDENGNPQMIDSAATSRPQVTALHRKIANLLGPVNLDLGGGKYDISTEFLAQHGVKNLVLDPYNRSEAHNADVLRYLEDNGGADSVTVCNVLNVINDAQARADVIQMAKTWAKGPVYFSTYEGLGPETGSGIGRKTRDGWQENRKTRTYIPEIAPYFNTVKILPGSGSKIIVAFDASEHRRSDMSKYDPMELERGIEVEFEHTDDPRIAKQIAMDHLDEDPHYYSRLLEAGITHNPRLSRKEIEDEDLDPDLSDPEEYKYDDEYDPDYDPAIPSFGEYPESQPSECVRAVERLDEARKFNDWYRKAISKTSKYVHPNLTNYILNADIWQPPGIDSVLIGIWNGWIFTVSHYAPNPEKTFDGSMLIRKAAHSADPIVFSVPAAQARHLRRAGFEELTEKHQHFGGELVKKHVMINAAARKYSNDILWALFQDTAE